MNRESKDLIAGLERAVEIICNEDYPEAVGVASISALVADLRDEIDYLKEYGSE